MRYTAACPSPVGRITLASDGRRLTGLWLEGQAYFGAGLSPAAEARPDLPVLRAAAAWAYWVLPLLLAYLLFPLSGLYLLLIGFSVPALAAACALYKPLAALQEEETT